jgi:hypothetical protein
MPTQSYWDRVRIQVAREAGQWSCGSEGRLLFENLVAHEDWEYRLRELAPENAEALFGVTDCAVAIVTNYFSQSI